eukprot:6336435-Prymnesium_polylepis.1
MTRPRRLRWGAGRRRQDGTQLCLWHPATPQEQLPKKQDITVNPRPARDPHIIESAPQKAKRLRTHTRSGHTRDSVGFQPCAAHGHGQIHGCA